MKSALLQPCVAMLRLCVFLLLISFSAFHNLQAQYVYNSGDPSNLANWTGTPGSFNMGTFTINGAATATSNWTLGGTAQLIIGATGSLTVNTGFVVTANSNVTVNGGLTLSGTGDQLVLNTLVPITLGPSATVTGTGLIKANNNNTVTIQCATLSPTWFTSGWIYRIVIDRPTDVTCNASLGVRLGGLQLANSGNLFFPGVGYTLTIEDGVGVSQTGTGKISLIGGGNSLIMQDDVLNGNHYVPGMNNLYVDRPLGVNLTNTLDIANLNYTSGDLNINNTGNLISSISAGLIVPATRTININNGGRVTVLPGKYFNNDGVVNVAAGGMVVLDADMTGNSSVGGMNTINYIAATSILRYTATGTPPMAMLAGPELPTPTMLGRVEVARIGANVLQINKVTNIQGGVVVQSGYCDFTAASNVVLGVGSQVQNGAYMRALSNSTVSGGANLTVQTGGVLSFSGTTISWTGAPTYQTGSLLDYSAITRTTLPELPSPMNGDVRLQGGSAITLSANTVMNGNFYALAGANTLTVPSPRVFTLTNTGNSIGAGATLTAQLGGEVRITGSLANSGAVDVPGTLTLSGAGALTGTAPTMFTGTLQYLNITANPYTTLTEFPASVGNLIINSAAAGNVIILANTKTVTGNTTITQGILQSSAVGTSLTQNLGIVSVAANGRLRVQENSTMNGTYTYAAPAATLEYAGTGAFTKSATNELTSVTPFGGSIIMNNPGHVDAPASLVSMTGGVGANFTLSSGRWRIPAGGELQLGAGVGYIGGNAVTFVELTPAPDVNNARLTRNLSVAANWHIGNSAASYRLVQTGTPTVSPTNITIGASLTGPSAGTATAPFASTFADGYWYFAANPASSVVITLRYPSVGAASRLGRFTNNGNANGAYTNVPATVAGNDITTTAAQPLSPIATSTQYYAIGTGPAATSDIVAATPAYAYNAPINLAIFGAAANQGNNVTPASVSLFEFDVRDLAGDSFATTMTDLNITLADAGGNLRRVALYDGATEVQELPATGTLNFTGFSVNIPATTTKRLSLRVTFNDNVTDQSTIRFTINSAIANVAGSTFAAFAPLVSSIAGNNNRISVVATQLAFPNSIGSQVVNTNFSPAVDVRAVDMNNNLDLDAAGTMTLTGAPIGVSMGGSVVLGAGVGVATFNGLQMAGTGTSAVTATLGALTGVSNVFMVNATPTYWGCTIPSVPPALPVLGIGGRNMNFSNVGMALSPAAPVVGTVSMTVNPGAAINMSFDWNMVWGSPYCPGCVVQMYVGIGGGSGVAGDGSSATGFTQCIGTGVSNFTAGSVPVGTPMTFTAPTKPGIYYITQNWTLHYYCNPHPVTFNNDPTNAIAVIRVIDPVPPSQGCNEADIIPTPAFVPPTNIPYASYTGAITGAHPAVWSFRIRDYGTIPTQGDIDNKPSTIAGLGVTVNDPGGILQEIALYDGTGLIQTQPVLASGTTTVTFSGIPAALRPSAPDDGVKDYFIRARFRTTPLVPPMDNRQVSFSINHANITMDAPAVSTQKATAAPIAGPSSTAGNDNRVEVIASQLQFVAQPPATTPVGVPMASAVTVRAQDANNNIDIDYNAPNVSLTHPNLIGSPVTTAPAAGLATFPAALLAFNNLVVAGTLTASSGALTAGTSNAFDITAAIFHQMATGVNANVLTNWQLNGAGANPAALGLSGATYLIGATPGAATATVTASVPLTINPNSTFTVNNGSTLVVANGVGVTNNGALNIQGGALGGKLQMVGTGVILGGSMNNVTYAATTATLEYVGPVVIPRITTSREFPAAFGGRFVMNRPAGAGTELSFDNSKTIAGEFQQIGGGDIILDVANTLTVNGGATISAGNFTINNNAQLITNNSFVKSGGNINGSANAVFTANGAFTNTAGNLVWNSALGITLNGETNWDVGTLTLGGAGNLIVGAAGSFTLNGGSVSLANTGAFTCNGAFANPSGNIAIGSSTFTLNGLANFGGGGINSALNAGTVRVLGASALTGTFNNVSAGYGMFEMNRAGQTLALAPGNLVTNTLLLNNGIIQPFGANRVEVTNTFTATGGATTYIDGKLRRTLSTAALMNAGPFEFTIGKAGRYLPIVLHNVDAAANTGVEAEAFSSAPMGGMAGPLFSSISTTEYWQTTLQGGNLTSARILLSRASPVLPPAAVVGQNGTQGGMYSGLGGAPSPPTVLSLNAVTTINRFFAIGSLPNTFFYFMGPAENAGSWNSDINGAGSPALDFVTSGQTFIVPNGRTATLSNNATFGTLLDAVYVQVENGGTLAVETGRTLTATTLLRINGGGRLRLQGTASVVAPSGVQYLAPTATLEYRDAMARLTNETEMLSLPNFMQGSVELKNSTIILNGSKSLQNLTLDNSTLSFGANIKNAHTLTVQGAMAATAPAIMSVDTTNHLTIPAGTGTLSGAWTVQGNIGSLSLNRSGQTLEFADNFSLVTTLTLSAGNIRMASNKTLFVRNPLQSSIVGGGVGSFVLGKLSRALAPNLSSATIPQTNYAYPIGALGSGMNARFYGAILQNVSTGTLGAEVSMEAFAANAGGTVAPGVTGALSTTEYWRSTLLSGEFLGGNVAVNRQSPVIAPTNVLGTSLTQAGAYSSLGGTFVGTGFGSSLQGQSVQHGALPVATVNAERFYAVLGVLPNAPRIFGFSPTFGGNGTTIRVTGANFSTIQAVAIGGVPVFSFTLLGDSVLTATILNGVSGAVQISGTAGGAASDSVFRFIPPPSIGMVTPNPAGIGSTITIPGTNLRETNYLTIGGVEIPISPMNIQPDGSLQVVIPPNVTFGTIVLGTPGGSIEDTTALVLVPRPVILSVSPQVASTGEILTLLGQNFQNVRFVRLGGGASRTNLTNAVFTVNSPTRISVIIPAQTRRSLTAATLALEKNSSEANAINPDIVPITVIAAGGTATTNTTDVQQFFYRSIAPTMGGGGTGGNENLLRQIRVDAVLDRVVALGERVRVTGANLEFVVGIELSTALGTMTTASWQVTSSAQLSIIVPRTGLLNGTNASASSIATTVRFIGAYNQITVPNAFIVAARPVVVRVLPTNAEPGETIRLEGENLRLAEGITVGDVPVPFIINPDGSITLTIPRVRSTDGTVTPAAGALVVRGIGGSSSPGQTIINASYLSGQPVITSFSPSAGAGGSIIVVTGANFTAITGVLVGGVPVQDFIVNSGNRLTLILSTQASARAEGSISLVTPLGVVESRQNFRFTQSLEGDIVRLAQALNISVDAVRARVVEERNQLVSVNLSGVRLAGGIVPDVLRTFPRLRVLNLSNTGLAGSITRALPAWIQGLADIEDIDVSFNELEGGIASEPFCAYPNLKRLNASNNRLAGTIPLCLTTREKLQVLQLSNNRFEGSIPAGLGTLPNLRVLNLANNRLTGNLPSSFGQISPNKASKTTSSRAYDAETLEVLDLSINELTGNIPAEWSAMASLKTLNLSRNRLSGELAPSLASWAALEHINLNENSFTGAFPVGFGNARNLRVVRLAKNGFTSVPNMSTARRLDSLDVQNNRLDFGSLEQYAQFRTITGVQALLAPQDSVGVGTAQEIRVGERVRFLAGGTQALGGTKNRYEWRRNGVLLDTNTDKNLSLVNAGAELRILATRSTDAGVYTCSITNDDLAGIELWSRSQSLVVTSASVSAVQVILQQPTNESENISVRPRMQWRGVRGMDGYEVQVAADATFRTVLERQIVPHVVNNMNTASAVLSDEPMQETRIRAALGRGERVYWRVRAVSSGVQGVWSAEWSFRVVPLGVDIAVGTLDAGKASIGDASTAQSVAVNVGNDAVEIEDIQMVSSDTTRFRLTTRLTTGKTTTLSSGGELPIEVVFTPKEQGFARGTVEMRYRDGQGTQRTVRFQAIARGSGAAVLVPTVAFDTMRVGNRTVRSAELINRSTERVKIVQTRVLAGSLQTLASNRSTPTRSRVYELPDAIVPSEPVLMAAGDTLPTRVRAFPTEVGTQRGILEVLVASADAVIDVTAQGAVSVRPSSAQAGAWLDTVRVEVRGEARLPQNTDAVLRVGIRTQQDSVAPGGTTRLEVYALEGSNKAAILRAGLPVLRGTVSYGRQVLRLGAANLNGARAFRETTGTSRVERVQIPRTSWDGRSEVLFQCEVQAVAGDTDRTALVVENFVWGDGNPSTRAAWEAQVFVEEPEAGVFTARACVAGGKRLVTSAKATALAVVRPNPVKDVAEIAVTLREDGPMLLEVVSLRGEVVAVLAEGEYAAGEQSFVFAAKNLPSGSYQVRLTTRYERKSVPVMVVR